MTMDAKVDYLSYTVLHDLPATQEGFIPEVGVLTELMAKKPATWAFLDRIEGWHEASARGHYKQSLMAANYTKLSWGGQANHILIELPGTACQAARDLELLPDCLQEAAERATRLDIACDVVEGCKPRDFVAAGYSERFGAYAEIVSPDGETEYVGSMKSDRYARVYMYNEPHPRAGILRIEHVLRRQYAKAAIGVLQETRQLIRLVCQLGNTFGWQSDYWIPECASEGRLKASRADRNEPGRVRWLYEVVMPAMVKADTEGLIELDSFIERTRELRRSRP